MSRYSDTLERLYGLVPPHAEKAGLESVSAMMSALGNPHLSYRVVHCAGTNGKGSTVTKIAAALGRDGHAVGLYTSPHISSFRERIVVNGVMISEDDVSDILSELFSLGIEATVFEMTTALAFVYFSRKGVDIAVMEVGIGGRLDATNIVVPAVSIITSISRDHVACLGADLVSIAREKAGIIKQGVPVVLGPKARGFGIEEIAAERRAPCIEVDGVYDSVDDENSAIARKALELLGVAPDSIEGGLVVRPPCRFEERVIDGVRIIFDVAHNIDGFERLFTMMCNRYSGKRIRAVVGFCADKEIKECLAIVSAYASAIHLVAGKCARCAPAAMLSSMLSEKQPERILPTIAETMRYAVEEAKKRDDIVVVCGSFYIMDEACLAIDEKRLRKCEHV